MKREYFRLLCLLFISFFIIGFGGEVRAEEKTFNIRDRVSYRNDGYDTYYNWFYTDDNEDAWCLNSSRDARNRVTLSRSATSLIPAEKKNSVINVLTAGSNLNLDAGLKYYITQAAVWYVLNGVGTDGITPNFKNWIESNYPNEWDALVGRENLSRVNEPSISVSATDYKLDFIGDDHNNLYSKDISINSEGIGTYVAVIVDNGVACKTDLSECASTLRITKNEKFKIKVANPGDSSGTVKASFTAKPEVDPYVYDINTYVGIDTGNGTLQDMGVLVPVTKAIDTSHVVSGTYTNTTEIRVQKKDKETGDIVAGAKLYIADDSGKRIGTYVTTSTGSEAINLPEGEYYLGEATNPGGYYYNSERVKFKIINDGGTLKVTDKDGNPITGSVPTITFENLRRKIKFRKVDSEGNPVAGVQFQIRSYSAAATGDSKAGLCALTDQNGYLTIPCTNKPSGYIDPKSDGVYTLGVDFGVMGESDGLYQILETCPTGNDSCKQYFIDGKSTSFNGFSDSGAFAISGNGSNIVLLSDNITLSREGTDASHPTVVINLINRNYIKIKKVNITTGKEVPGAKLTVKDLTVSTSGNSSNMTNSDIVASWVSTDEPYTIVGIVPGRKYRLIEEKAAPGYVVNFVQNQSKIDFIMDENGNVTTYDTETGAEIKDLKGTNYELLVTNDTIKTVFSKTSATTGEEIAGANLKVCTEESYNAAKASTGDGNNCMAFERVNSEGKNEVISWVSEKGVSKTIDALPAGKYYLVEELPPEGYVRQVNAKDFVVKDDGTIEKVEMKNETTKLFISKKDVLSGEEVEGAQIKICTLESYESDGSNCKPDKDEWSWTSGKETKLIEALPFGDYVLIETLPAPEYQEGMIIDGDLMTAYKFSISQEDNEVRIDVYNQLLTDVPNTGISTLNLFAIGGLMVFVGYETIKIYRRRALNN